MVHRFTINTIKIQYFCTFTQVKWKTSTFTGETFNGVCTFTQLMLNGKVVPHPWIYSTGWRDASKICPLQVYILTLLPPLHCTVTVFLSLV